MEYSGTLYAKIEGKYIRICHTDDFETLEAKAQRLQDNIIEYQKQVDELKDKYNKCMQNSIV